MESMKLVGFVCMAAAAVVIIALVLIPAIESDHPAEQGWQYDDYRPVSDWAQEITSADGSLELKTRGEITYVHAKALGTGTIRLADGAIQTVHVGRAVLDAFLTTGQSNTLHTGDASLADPYCELGTAYFWNGGSLHEALGGSGSKIMQAIYPPLMATYYELTGHKILVVMGGIGGQSITTFEPGTGTTWTYAQEQFTSAIAAFDTSLYDIRIQSVFWIQGEADRLMDADTYYTKFMEFADAILTGEMNGYDFRYLIISKVRAANGPTASEAQIRAAENDDRIIMATTVSDTFTVDNGLINSDDLHYSQLGKNLIGVAFGETAAETVVGSETVDGWKLLSLVPVLIIVAVVVSVATFVFRHATS